VKGKIILILAAATFVLASVSAVAQERLPNIVFILADDLGYADLGCYGHPDIRTPVLDQLATEGTRFESFHVTGITCCPSRTCFMTSRHPASYPAYMSGHGFADRVTVTELLHERGYKVGHFGKWHIGPVQKQGTYGIDDVNVIGGSNDDHQGRDSKLFTAAIDFIEENNDVPFYVNVWGHISHYAVNPHESLVDDFNDFMLDSNDYGNWQQGKFDLSQAIIDDFNLPEDLTMAMRNYMGDVYSLDIQVGHLLAKLDELGLRDNTIVVFSSDQGPAPVITVEKVISDGKDPDSCKNMLGYVGQLSGGKHTQLEGGVQVPFIIRWPGHVPSDNVNSTSKISAMDWLPTLCSIAGITIDANALQIEGEDVSDILLGSTRSPDRPLFWKTSSVNSAPAMLEGNWKLHRPKKTPYELYDLDTDPGEVNNLATVRVDILDAMTPKLDAWVATLPGAYLKGDVNSPMFPVADAGVDQQVFDLDSDGFEPITLDASDSNDPDGYISGCIWRENGEVIAVADGPTVSLSLGTHVLEVEATDYHGNTAFDNVTITVSASSGLGAADLSLLCSYWLGYCQGPEWCGSMDTNHDNGVDLLDLSFLANLWIQ
jgi:N-acetylgalactosamine-6-sulfatase